MYNICNDGNDISEEVCTISSEKIKGTLRIMGIFDMIHRWEIASTYFTFRMKSKIIIIPFHFIPVCDLVMCDGGYFVA